MAYMWPKPGGVFSSSDCTEALKTKILVSRIKSGSWLLCSMDWLSKRSGDKRELKSQKNEQGPAPFQTCRTPKRPQLALNNVDLDNSGTDG